MMIKIMIENALIILIVTNILFISLAIYFYLKSKKVIKKESIELQDFLRDLLNGDSLIHVRRIAPDDIMIRSRSRR